MCTTPQGYKQVGSLQIPAEWEYGPADRYICFQTGYPFPSQLFRLGGDGIRLIKNRDLKSDDQIYTYHGEAPQEYLVRNGDLLVSMDGDFAPCRWMKGEALLNQRVGRILPKEQGKVSLEYLQYALCRPLEDLQNVTSGTTVKHLTHHAVGELVLPFPDYAEQCAIAAALTDMDKLIAAQQALMEKKQAIKQGALQELLTGQRRLVSFLPAERKAPAGGRLPRHWELTTLSAHAEVIPGVSYTPRDVGNAGTPRHIPLLRANNISDGHLIPDDLVYVHEDCIKKSQILRPQDIVVCMSNGSRHLVGKAGLNVRCSGCTFGIFTALVRAHENETADYIIQLMQSGLYSGYISACLAGSAINNITADHLRDFTFPMPPRDERMAIARVLSDMDAEISALSADIRKNHAIKQGMMQQLLTGRIRLPRTH